MSYFFGEPLSAGTDVSSFLNLFIYLIANAQIQDIARDQRTQRNHPQVKLHPTKKINSL